MANENQKGQDLNEILRLRREKLAQLQEAGKDPFQITKFDVTAHSTDVLERFEELEGKEVAVAGRLMAKRVMGKASFGHIQDKEGKVQCYVTRDNLGEEAYTEFKRFHDVGDIIGVVGEVFRTQKGEISVKAKQVTLLTKSLQTMPEKYHGLTD
ncbi:MAG: lysine--tRNA ligase, partial [Firmicutes bacterium]|nr:lysine--tRNA ligase [Bacillota bacterium]